MHMSTVPVSISLPCPFPLAKCEGLMRIEDGDLVLEYQTRDAIVGIVKSSVHEVRIPRNLLALVTIRKDGFFGFGTKVVIRSTRMQPVPGTDIPGMTQGQLVLDIAERTPHWLRNWWPTWAWTIPRRPSRRGSTPVWIDEVAGATLVGDPVVFR